MAAHEVLGGDTGGTPAQCGEDGDRIPHRMTHNVPLCVPPRRFERPTPALGWQGTAFWFFIPLFAMILRVSRRLSVAVCC